jgi:hypothetical protein
VTACLPSDPKLGRSSKRNLKELSVSQIVTNPVKAQGRRGGRGRGRDDRRASRLTATNQQNFFYAGFEYESLQVRFWMYAD